METFQELSRAISINSFTSGDIVMIRNTKIKNQQGFTLVEVIVVAIIVAALAAVAIPLYNGYVSSSRNNAAANAAGSIASFMGACINQGGNATGIAEATAVAGPFTITCAGTPAPAAQTPTITVPAGVTITISKLAASPGTVTGLGGTGLANQLYSY
jgi:type IV pilus assembly protein PilA